MGQKHALPNKSGNEPLLTKDAGAYCLTGTTLDNSTTISFFDPKENTYKINDNDVRGHFSFHYTGAQIYQNVSGEF
ncbi:hypothetical protein Lal_00040613 [Lupinus albus]|nr:hypothetical protein Lal_00040613 [Lupinus albus]